MRLYDTATILCIVYPRLPPSSPSFDPSPAWINFLRDLFPKFANVIASLASTVDELDHGNSGVAGTRM
jgi:hypothetical protein